MFRKERDHSFLKDKQMGGADHLVTAVVMEVSMTGSPCLSALTRPGYKYIRAVNWSQIYLYSNVPFCRQVGQLLSSLLKDFLFIVSVKVGLKKKHCVNIHLVVKITFSQTLSPVKKKTTKQNHKKNPKANQTTCPL